MLICPLGSLLKNKLWTEVCIAFASLNIFQLPAPSSAPGCMPDSGYPHTLPPAPAETSYEEDWEVFDPWVQALFTWTRVVINVHH